MAPRTEKHDGKDQRRAKTDAVVSERLERLHDQETLSLDAKTVHDLSDELLLEVFRAHSRRAFDHQDRLFALLPEIRRRGLYRRKGCSSIEEFAQRHCRISRKTIREILRVYDRVRPCPRCNELFESALVGWTKFQVIATHLDPSNDACWAEHVQTMTKEALRELCKSLDRQESGEGPDLRIRPSDTYANLRFHVIHAESLKAHVQRRRKLTGRHVSRSEVLNHLVRLGDEELSRLEREGGTSKTSPPTVQRLSLIHI